MESDAEVAPASFLDYLKSLYPATEPAGPAEIVANPWYLVATVAYASCNSPEAASFIFLHVIEELEKAQKKAETDAETAHKQRLQVARRLRESLLKSCLLCGAPRAINAMVALHEVMPEDLRDKEMIRNPRTSTEEFDHFGGQIFRAIHGEGADGIQRVFNEINPDFGWIARVVGCGMLFGQTDLLSLTETSYVMLGAMYGMETSRQFSWHLVKAKREAKVEQARGVRQICIEVGNRVGFKWKEPVPDVE
ncbi:hypothetical protein NM688_g2256 [Phlebia brevispora]|uniref:Uncharacterized protein n=1 Tax=Phlebia brevispora TaxID=194682 RepID=A0ACC1T9D8_9APHY|nr:hypothetical protein NM688_g2256 [Phlebia brevispora]